jgi:hypothetical protein
MSFMELCVFISRTFFKTAHDDLATDLLFPTSDNVHFGLPP